MTPPLSPAAVPPTYTMSDAWAELLALPQTYWGLAVLSFLFGLLWGSFFNVCIYRLPLGLSVNRPNRSFCFRCGTTVRWYDNIPVVSYLLLRGRCRSCGSQYGPRYMVVEILTGLIFLALFLSHNRIGSYHLGTLWYWGFASVLIIGTFTDLDHWILPDEVSRTGAVLAILASIGIGFLDPVSILSLGGPFPAVTATQGDVFEKLEAWFVGPAQGYWGTDAIVWWHPIANALIGAFGAAGMLWAVGLLGRLVLRKEAMGFGDVKLFFVIGASVGFLHSIWILVLASFFGSVGGITGILLARLRGRTGGWAALEAGTPNSDFTGPMSGDGLSSDGELTPSDERPISSNFATVEEELEAQRELAQSLGLQFDALDQPEHLLGENFSIIPENIVAAYHVRLLAQQGKNLTIATADPQNSRLILELKQAFPEHEITFVIAPESRLKELCDRREAIAKHIPQTVGEERELVEGRRGTRNGDVGDRTVLEKSGVDAQAQSFTNLQEKTKPLSVALYETLARQPKPPRANHLPFIPWIAAGCLTFLFFFPSLRLLVIEMLFPYLTVIEGLYP